MMRSIGAVVAGFVVWSFLWLGGNIALSTAFPDAFDANGMTTDAGMLVGVLIWSVVLSVVSGLIAGAVARQSKVTHGVVLGVLLLIVGVGVQVSVWNQMPIWYHLPFLALIVPGNVVGASLSRSRLGVDISRTQPT